MKCPSCGFISFKSSKKCFSCEAKLEDFPGPGKIAEGAKAFTIFLAPSLSVEGNSTGNLAKSGGESSMTSSGAVAVSEGEFDLDLSDAVAEGIIPGSSDISKKTPPTVFSKKTDANTGKTVDDAPIDPGALAVDHEGQEDEEEFRLDNFEPEPEVADATTLEISSVQEEPAEDIEFSLEPELESDEPVEATTLENAEATAAPSVEPSGDIEFTLEPEEPAEKAVAPTAAPFVEPSGDIEFTLEPEEPAEKAVTSTPAPPIEPSGDIEFILEPEEPTEKAVTSTPAPPIEPLGDIEFILEPDYEMEEPHKKLADDPEIELEFNEDDIEIELEPWEEEGTDKKTPNKPGEASEKNAKDRGKN